MIGAHAPHLRLLPPPPLTNMGMDHPVWGVVAVAAILERIRLADESSDLVAASNARADLRAALEAAREEGARVDLDPYRTATPARRPLPLLIVLEVDPAAFRAFVGAEGISRSRVTRRSTIVEALDAEFNAQRQGRQTMIIEEAS